METRIIFFVGKPGCGKGTQAKLLAEKTELPIFASGKLFRSIAQEDTSVGRKIRAGNDAGFLAPYWFATHLYLQSLFSIPDNIGAIFDGFSRKVPEAELIVDSLRWLNRSFFIIYIAVSDEEVYRRLANRKKTDGRADDSVIGERLEEYYAHTAKAIEIFRDASVLIEINGEQPPEEIAVAVHTALAAK